MAVSPARPQVRKVAITGALTQAHFDAGVWRNPACKDAVINGQEH